MHQRVFLANGTIGTSHVVTNSNRLQDKADKDNSGVMGKGNGNKYSKVGRFDIDRLSYSSSSESETEVFLAEHKDTNNMSEMVKQGEVVEVA